MCKRAVGTQNVPLKGKPVKRITIAHSCARLMMQMVCMKQTRRFNAYRVGRTAGITCLGARICAYLSEAAAWGPVASKTARGILLRRMQTRESAHTHLHGLATTGKTWRRQASHRLHFNLRGTCVRNMCVDPPHGKHLRSNAHPGLATSFRHGTQLQLLHENCTCTVCNDLP